MKWGQIWKLLHTTFQEWSEDKASRLAAALAYYTIFSLPPLLILIIGIVGLFVTRTAIENALVEQFGGLAGQQGAQQIQTIIQGQAGPGGGLVATIVGVVTLLLGASGLFGQLQDSLNTIFDVKPKPGQGILAALKSRFLSFTMVLGTAFLLLVSFVLSAALSALGNYIGGAVGLSDVLLGILNFVLSFGVVTLVFGLIFKVLPDVEMSWRDAFVGSAFTALLFTIGRFALGAYLGNSSVGSAFGAAGALAVILVWIYYAAQILFLGAEFTQVYARMYGSEAVPEPQAEWLSEEERAQQGVGRETRGPERQAKVRDRQPPRGEETEQGRRAPAPQWQPAAMVRRTFFRNANRRRAVALGVLAVITGLTFLLRNRQAEGF